MFYIDPVYFWYVLIPVLIISLGVQVYLKRTYAKWSKIRNSSDLTGMQVGKGALQPHFSAAAAAGEN